MSTAAVPAPESMMDPSPQSPVGAVAAPSFKHVILTRFNVRWDEAPDGPSIGTDPAWLEPRFELFERYCLPSMLSQSRRDFSWILFFDHETPEPFASRARALQALPGIFPVFCRTLPLERVGEAIVDVLGASPDWLLTTRLDNDDGLHQDFVATVQDAQSFGRAEVLNCPTGIVLSGQRAYRQRHLSNAFISLSEPFGERRTIFSISRHVYASEAYPVRQLRAEPMWLQVIHGGNVSNRVRGRRVLFASAARGFPVLTDGDEVSVREGAWAILAENMTLNVARSIRELVRATVRRSAKCFGLDLRRRASPRRGNGTST